jgi:hypothetical protein
MPKPASLFRYQAIGHTGPVSATIAFRQGRTPAVIYYDPELRVPARNPCPTDSLGRVNLYMPAGESYEVTVQFPDGSTDQFMHTAVPIGGPVETVREVPVETVREVIKEVPGPERVVYKDRIEYVQVKPDLEKLQAAADALRKARKEAEVPPPELAHLIRTGETYEQTNMRLLPIYREAQHHKERAADDGNKTERVQWEAKIRKLDLAMHWMHGRLIETI